MKTLTTAIAASALLLLGGCASMPTGPSVLVLPGTNRNFDDFRRDDMQCRQYALQQVGGGSPTDPAVRSAVVGTAVGAAAGAAIGGQQGAAVGAGTGLLLGGAVGAGNAQNYAYGSQRYYDNAYIQCMYGKGHRVPVPASLAKNYNQAPAAPAVDGNYPPSPPPSFNPPSSPPPDYFPPPPAAR